MYNKRTWLNKDTSSSTSNVVAFDGMVKDGEERMTFLSISDCKHTIILHAREDESFEDFINKMKLLENEIRLFIHHLNRLEKDNS